MKPDVAEVRAKGRATVARLAVAVCLWGSLAGCGVALRSTDTLPYQACYNEADCRAMQAREPWERWLDFLLGVAEGVLTGVAR